MARLIILEEKVGRRETDEQGHQQQVGGEVVGMGEAGQVWKLEGEHQGEAGQARASSGLAPP